MRIFLAGASGVLGRRIVPLLTAAHHHVVALTRDGDPRGELSAAGAEVVVGDVLDAARIEHLIAAARCDVVMDQLTDLRAGSSVRNAELRRDGTARLLDAADRAGVGRVIAQSIAWAYAPGEQPAVERTPLDVDAAPPRRTTIDGVVALESRVARTRTGCCFATAPSTGRVPGTRRAGAGLTTRGPDGCWRTLT